MRWERVNIEAIAYSLPEERVRSSALEARLDGLYSQLRLPRGQLEALSGVLERRFWPPGPRMATCAAQAGAKALDAATVRAEDVGALLFCGVCRDDLEPSVACGVADRLGVRGDAILMDVGNACLGVLDGILTAANMIELGQVRAALVVSAESAREIAESTIDHLLREGSLDAWRRGLASLTGGSAAIAVLLTDRDFGWQGHQLLGAVGRAAPQHHRLARWGPSSGLLGERPWVMETDGAAVLQHGIDLGRTTFAAFLDVMRWRREDLDHVVMHQVGRAHESAILDALAVPAARNFGTYAQLGNTGSCAIPLTAALLAESGRIAPGERLALLGIGTGLNTMMMGVQW